MQHGHPRGRVMVALLATLVLTQTACGGANSKHDASVAKSRASTTTRVASRQAQLGDSNGGTSTARSRGTSKNRGTATGGNWRSRAGATNSANSSAWGTAATGTSDTTGANSSASNIAATETTATQETGTSAEKKSFFGILARDQKSDGKTVMIDKVSFAKGTSGFVVIHADEGGHQGIRGVSAFLRPGIHEHVPVTFTVPISTTTTLIAMLHADANGTLAYEGDPPVLVNDNFVTSLFTAAVG